MKNIYTPEEINKLSTKELSELFSFVSESNSYFYSDLKQIKYSEGEYSFHLVNNDVIYTQDKDTYESVKAGKIRFDLISKSLEQNSAELKMREDFFNQISTVVSDQVNYLNSMSLDNTKRTNEVISNANTNISDLITGIDSKVNKMISTYESKMKEFEAFNTKTYEIKMKKVDAIIDAFGTLLED